MTFFTRYRALVISLLLLGLLGGVGLLKQPAHAQAGQAFSISPPLIELQADPGKQVQAQLKLTNISAGELMIEAEVNDFGSKNETGEPNIIFDNSDDQNTPYSLRKWITPPAPFVIKSRETKTITVPISVPANAEPGGHYAVVRFTGSATPNSQSGLSLSASIGTLILLQVSGDIKEKASIADFYTATPRFVKTSFFEDTPLTFLERIRNDGNIHIKPSGTIEVFNMFGKKIETMRVNGNPKDTKDDPKSILPQSTRRFDQTLNKNWLFGKYEARLHLKYGNNQQPLTSTITFWVIPYKLIILVLVGLMALLVGGRWGIRRYNQWVIRKSRGKK